MWFGVLEGADDDGQVHFTCRPPVGSRRRDVENRGERAGGMERAQRVGRGQSRETRVDQDIGNLRNNRKTVFDVTPSGANGRSTCKMKLPTIISTLENPETHCFSESRFLSCAKTILICPILRQTAYMGPEGPVFSEVRPVKIPGP
ncbi:hypothetical protein PRIPAC_96827, partial [Pristionchus pacificus]|uniref:Uncharacterized protein n=1 Tax=Pristionchus pacificus TaxID=54126 RepID=A0A2A6CUW1_PRIPA